MERKFLACKGMFSRFWLSTKIVISSILQSLMGDSGNRFWSSLQNIFTITALIIAGIWFFQKTEHVPRLNLSHEISQFDLNENIFLTRAVINIENIGNVPIKINTGSISINQVYPFENKVKKIIENAQTFYSLDPLYNVNTGMISWPFLLKRELKIPISIGPGEMDEISFDFLLPNDVKVFQVSSLFTTYKTSSAWFRQTYHKHD